MSGGIKKRADGRFSTSFTVDGKRYYIYGRTARECRDKEYAKRQEIEQSQKTLKDPTLDQYFDRWIEDKEGTVKETTIRSNHTMYRNLSSFVVKDGRTLGELRLSEVDTRHVKELQTSLKKRLATRTVNDVIAMLGQILQSAIDERLIDWNPAKVVKPLRRTEPLAADTIHRALTVKETKLFIKAASGSWYYNLYIFLLHTGIRVGEAGTVTPSDISAEGVHIHRTVTRTKSGGYMIGTDTKTKAGNRFVPLDDEAMKAISAQRQKERLVRGDGISDFEELSEPVFKTPEGKILRSSPVNVDIKRICKKTGIEPFTVHAFRDTFATRCAESHMDVKQLQSIMGHTNITMTLGLYAHANDELKSRQLKAVNFM